jgi:hypothetical protein
MHLSDSLADGGDIDFGVGIVCQEFKQVILLQKSIA